MISEEGLAGRVGCGCGMLPVSKAGDAFAEIAAGLIFWVYRNLDVDLGEHGSYPVAQVFGEGIVVTKSRLASLQS